MSKEFAETVQRSRLFYCAHMNRKNAFFQKHILNQKRVISKVTPKETADKIYDEMFGFTRLRGATKTNILSMLEHVVKKQKTFDYNYYITKNCPLPQGWRTEGLKDKLAAQAKEGPIARK